MALQLNCEFKAFSVNTQKSRNDAHFTLYVCLFVVVVVHLLQPNRCIILNPRWFFLLVSLHSLPRLVFCITRDACVKPAQSTVPMPFRRNASAKIKQANEKKINSI